MIESLSALFERNLEAVKKELTSFSNEENMWQVPEGVINSAGNLSLHLIGNLNHFIGSVLGSTGYLRRRDAEFSDRHVPRSQIIEEIEGTSIMIKKVLLNLSKEDLQKTFPIEVFGYSMTTEYFLIHLLGHLEYHRGQMNYARRVTEA